MPTSATRTGAASAEQTRASLNGGERRQESRTAAASASSLPRSDDHNDMRDTFASRVFAPATHWYDDMQWTRKKKAKMSSKASLELVASYAPDWILTILVAGLLQLINKIYGFRREFSLTDTSLQHTFAVHERVSVGLLGVVAFVIPVALMGIVSLGISRSIWDFHAGFLGIVVTHALTLTATTIIKVSVGRPRPDIIDRCQPRAGAMDAVPYGLVTDAICTTDLHSSVLRDGFRSFPSGHASTAFAGLTFLTLYFAGKVHFWQRGHGSAASAWLLFTPMFGAAMVAVSRTMDYRHHATDVIAGAILGFVTAVSTYHNYYPPLWNMESQKPWSPRLSAARRWKAASRQDNAGNELGTSYSRDADYDAAATHFAMQIDDDIARRTRRPSLGEYARPDEVVHTPAHHTAGHGEQTFSYDANSSESDAPHRMALREVVVPHPNARQ